MTNALPVTVLLVMPPQKGLLDGFATGLMCLHSHLGRVCPNVPCEIVDFSSTSEDDIAAWYRSRNNETVAMEFLVGITTTSASCQAALTSAAIAKSQLSRCRVVLGGPHASADSKTILERHPELLDYIVVGEGERALEQLVKEYPDPKSVPGVAYLDSEAHYRLNQAPVALHQVELDKIDVLYRGGFAGTPGKFKTTTYVSARGCPLKCAFCSGANTSGN